MKEEFFIFKTESGLPCYIPATAAQLYFNNGQAILAENNRPIVIELGNLTLTDEIFVITHEPTGPVTFSIEKAKNK